MQNNLIPLTPPTSLEYSYDDDGNILNHLGNIISPSEITSAETVSIYLLISEICRLFYTLSLAWNGRFSFSRTSHVKKDMWDYKTREMETIVSTIPLWSLQNHLLFLHPRTLKYLSYLHQELNWRYYEDLSGDMKELKLKEPKIETQYEEMVHKFAHTTLDFFHYVLHHLSTTKLKYSSFLSYNCISEDVLERIRYDIIGKCKSILESIEKGV